MRKTACKFWVCSDNPDGTETEEFFSCKASAVAYYDALTMACYKKIVAIYEDHDETIMTYRAPDA